MRARPIIDAGPALNFLAINKERLLLSVFDRISTPESVEEEILRKARTDHRFKAVQTVWPRLTVSRIEILSDDATPELEIVVNRISALPMAQRKAQAKDLGEVMVVAHAVVAAQAGCDVVVIIDDQAGAALATAEGSRLTRLQAQGRTVGSIKLVNTTTILHSAAGGPELPNRAKMRDVYARLRQCDDGLLPIEKTELLSPRLWK